MKKMMMMAVFATAFTLNISAQEVKENQDGQRFDRTEMIQRRTEAMAKQYGLDEAQQKKLVELNKKYPQAMPFMGGRHGGPRGGMRQGMGNRQRPDGDNGQRPRRQMGQGGQGGHGGPGFGQRGRMGRPGMPDKATMEKYNSELKTIMSEEQYKKYEADRMEALKRFNERRAQMQQAQPEQEK